MFKIDSNTKQINLTRGDIASFKIKAMNDDSLNNILKMCINVSSSYSRAKTLYELGLKSNNYPASRIQALSNYNDFITAGWSIGY